MSERIGIYYHKAARKEKIRGAIAMSDTLGNTSTVQEVTYPLPRVPDALSTLVVVGGDGTVRSVAERMMERDDPGTLVVVNGGTNNAFHGSLLHEGSSIRLHEIPEAHNMDIAPFHPGQVNEKHVFMYMAEQGRVVEQFGAINEGMRGFVPRGGRPYAAGLVSGVWESLKRTDEPLVQAFFTAGEFKGSILSPHQSLYDENLIRISVPAMNAPALVGVGISTIRSMRDHVPFPEDLFTVEQAPSFATPIHTNKIGMGGDIFDLAEHELRVRRMDKSIRATALEIPPARRTRL